MKKIMLTACAAMVFAFTNAQEVKFGIKSGINFSNLEADIDGSLLTGVHLGGFAEIKLSDKFAIQPEILFSQQGSYFIAMELTGKREPLPYINIPVIAKYYVLKKLSLEAGPQVGFSLRSLHVGYGAREYINPVDFSLNLGAGYDFTKNISLGIRYNVGLTNVYQDYTNKANNRVFSTSIGYKF